MRSERNSEILTEVTKMTNAPAKKTKVYHIIAVLAAVALAIMLKHVVAESYQKIAGDSVSVVDCEEIADTALQQV